MQRWRTDGGYTSYEMLADRLGCVPRTHRVMDLACGDGFLLHELAQRGFTELIGVDRSPHELSAARNRLGRRARLYEHDVRALPLPQQSIDVAVCHLALMLIEPVDSAIAEVTRVLRPGGTFLAVVNRALRDPVYEAYQRELRRITAAVGLPPLRLGDPRVFSAADFIAVLASGFRCDQCLIEMADFQVTAHTTRDELWSMLRLMYDVVRLAEDAQVELGERLIAAWLPQVDRDGLVSCRMGMRLVRVQLPV
jgi:SAM-dependent methyltransferase